MGKRRPLISVVMPAYNVQDYIGRAIESILNQTLKDFELIIINDASTDKTLSIIKEYSKRDSRIRIINNKRNLQIAESLNKAIRTARSNIIARMDADDFSFPNRLEIQYELLNSNQEIAIVGADMIVVNQKGGEIFERKYPASSIELKKIMFKYSPFAHPVVMFRKDVFEKFGGYNRDLVPCEDIDLWFKIGSEYKFASVPMPLLKYTLITKSSNRKKLRNLEVLNFKIRLNAIKKYGYKPNIYDLLYNFLQFITLWVMPNELRVLVYNFLRSNKLI